MLWAAPQDGLDGSFPSLAPPLCCTEDGMTHPPTAGGSALIETVTVTAYRLSDWFCTDKSPAGSAASPRDTHQQVVPCRSAMLVCTISLQQESQHTNPEFAAWQQLLPLDISILLGAAEVMGMN